MKRFKDFIKDSLYESNNLSRSQSAMDKFGMVDWSELPYQIQEECIKAGLKYEDKHLPFNNFGNKNYVNDISDKDIDIAVGMTDDDYKFSKYSYMCIAVSSAYYGDYSFNLVESRDKMDDFIKFLNNWSNIRTEIVDIINDLDSPIEHKSEIERFKILIIKMLDKYNIDHKGILVW